MNQQITTFPVPKAGKISLVVAPRAIVPSLMMMLAAMALRGRVIVVDGGNCFDGYALARALRRHTHQVQAALKQVWLSRAFTCYQMFALLSKTPADGLPTLAIDFLSTFYDDNVRLDESQRLLEACIPHLQRLSQSAPVIVSATPPAPLCAEKAALAGALQEAAGSAAWQFESLPVPTMPTLWGREL